MPLARAAADRQARVRGDLSTGEAGGEIVGVVNHERARRARNPRPPERTTRAPGSGGGWGEPRKRGAKPTSRPPQGSESALTKLTPPEGQERRGATPVAEGRTASPQAGKDEGRPQPPAIRVR